LRSRREEAVAHVTEGLAHLLIRRFARICHVQSIDWDYQY
jgi:hypothetical protein